MLELRPDRFGLSEYDSHPVSICGKSFVADMSGALYWPGEHMLVVADLHLEKGSSFAEGGQLLPPYDTRETLLRLAQVIDKYGADKILSLGDSFHDPAAYGRMADEDKAILEVMQEGREWIWVAGNHDRTIADDVRGRFAESWSVGGLTFRHEPTGCRATHEIAGHLHPAARLSVYGHAIRRRCFIGNGRRLILPAFGSYTGGLNILDDAFEPIFGYEGFAVWLLGDEGLYPIATRRLRPDRARK